MINPSGQRYSFVLEANQTVDNYCTYSYLVLQSPTVADESLQGSVLSRTSEPPPSMED